MSLPSTLSLSLVLRLLQDPLRLCQRLRSRRTTRRLR